MIKKFSQWSLLVLPLCLAVSTAAAQPQTASIPFAGMWSDPPTTAEGMLCFSVCTDAGIELLYAKMDDPANDDIPFPRLSGQIMQESIGGLFAARLTDFSRPGFPISSDSDRGFLRCEPPGLAMQIFMPHQLEFTIHEDRIDLHYGEWDARRTVWTDGRSAPPEQPDSLLGYSTGRMEGNTLVISTSHLLADKLIFINHSS